MSFRELSERVETEYSSATGPVQRFSRREAKDSEIATSRPCTLSHLSEKDDFSYPLSPNTANEATRTKGEVAACYVE
jgi:hypothetical protein